MVEPILRLKPGKRPEMSPVTGHEDEVVAVRDGRDLTVYVG